MAQKFEIENSLLREPTKPFDFEKENAQEVYQELRSALIRYQGLGLSANQVGYDKSVFVFGDSSNPKTIEVMFNPKIVDFSEETTKMDEACLSFKGLVAKKERSNTIRVRFANVEGEVKTATFNGLTARIIQHEMDHLNGVLFFDGMSDFSKRRMIEKANKRKNAKFVFSDLQ